MPWSALERARETLERATRTVVSKKDWHAFVRLLEQDELPAPALVRAVRRDHRHDE